MTEQTHARSITHASATYGLYIGLMLILIQTVQYLAGLYVSFFFTFLTGSLFIVAVVLSIRHYRENDQNGWLNYGQGLGIGALSSLGAGIIYGAFMLLLVTVIDKSFLDEMIMQTQEMMEASKMPADQVEEIIDKMQENSSPWQFGYTPLQYGISGLIISLIASIFLRKNPENTFENDTL